MLFSYATEDESGKMRPSPMLSELGIERIDVAELGIPEQTFDRIQSETVADDDVLPPLPSQ